MCSVAGEARVKLDTLALFSLGMIDQPVEQGSREALRRFSWQCGQVIDIQHFSPNEELLLAVLSPRRNLASTTRRGDTVV